VGGGGGEGGVGGGGGGVGGKRPQDKGRHVHPVETSSWQVSSESPTNTNDKENSRRLQLSRIARTNESHINESRTSHRNVPRSLHD